jgi:PAS domain S-box-containing protein
MKMPTDKHNMGESPIANIKRQPDPEMSRKELIEELGELRALTAGLLNTVPVAFIVLDSQWRLVYLNENALKLFENTRESLIGKLLEKIYPRNLGRMLSPQLIRELLEGKQNWTNKYTNYLHRWYKISANSSDFGIFIRLEDITSEMLVNRLLRLNEFSVNRARDMIFWFMPGGHIIYANISACDLLGHDVEALTKMKIADICPSYSADKWAGFVNDLKTKVSRTFELSLRARDGHLIPVEIIFNYLDYHGDEYIMAFARDITLRKKAEKALTEAKAEAELYVDLMSHDINNMNQVATGYLELALDMMRTDGRIDEDQIEMLSKPYEMLLNSSKLIENVRKVRQERSGYYKHQVMDIYGVLEDVINNYHNVAGRDVRIKLTGDGECRVAANELLKDIFMNLVGNSVKHSSGPITIKIAMAMVTVEGRPYCQVYVEDNGPGISDDIKAKLFHRLSLENAKARGKGFGLYLIKQLVDDFGGKFWMEDRVPGDYTKGAKFVVLLPAIDD